MSLPAGQVAGLASSIRAHEDRIRQLAQIVELARDEIAVHEVILALARDERVLDATDRCYHDKRFAASVMRAPAAGFTRHGVALPDGVRMMDPPAGDEGRSLRARLRHNAWDVTLTWDRETGFSAAPDTRRMRQVTAVVLQPHPDDVAG
jgi:hypothetical protein